MKVLHLVTAPQRRGAEIFAFELSRALDHRGHRTRIVYLYDLPPERRSASLPLRNGDQGLGGQKDHPFERLPGIHPGLARRILAAIDDFAPDIVQINGSRSVKYGCLARRLRPRSRWSLVYRSIGDPEVWLRGFRGRLLRFLLLPAVDALVTVSSRAREGYWSEWEKHRPVTQIPRAVDTDTFAPREDRNTVRAEIGARPETTVLVYVGSLTPEKRLDRLLRVGDQVARTGRDVELWLVGDGPLRGEARRHADRLALRTRFLGTRSDVPRLLGAADLLLLTSDTEGTPGVVLEAGAVGLPVVATRVGGVAECVEHGESGLLTHPDREDLLVDALLELIDNPERRHQLGAEGRRRVREQFSLERIANAYLDVYQRSLEHRRGEPS